jgi:hypothetical protein
MEERKINFERNEDPGIVEDPDGSIAKEIKKIYDNLNLNLGFCYDQLKAGSLTRGMMETHLSLSEHYVMDFLVAMGYDSILKRESEKRHIEIRNLNNQNRELRSQLGEKVTNEDFRERSKNISKSIRKWWNIKGFGHISEIKFTEYGFIEAKLSGSISEAYYDRDGRDAKGTKIKYLKELGFEFSEEADSLIMNDNNLNSLFDLISKEYPSAKIEEITICPSSRCDRTYKDIVIYIHDLNDIK